MRYRVIYFNVYVTLRFRCAQLVCILHVVLFDTLCVSFFNFLFLKLQFMRIKMYIIVVTDRQVGTSLHASSSSNSNL